jgi:hypothetical protein
VTVGSFGSYLAVDEELTIGPNDTLAKMGAIPSPVKGIARARTITKVVDRIVAKSLAAMADLIAIRTWPQPRFRHESVNQRRLTSPILP